MGRLYGAALKEIIEKIVSHVEDILSSYMVDPSYPEKIMCLKKDLKKWTASGQVKIPADFTQTLQSWYQDIFSDVQKTIMKLESNYREYVAAKPNFLNNILAIRSKGIDSQLKSDQHLVDFLILKKARKNLPVDYMTKLLPEILLSIFQYLDEKSLARLESTHTNFKKLILNSNLWERALEREINQDFNFKKTYLSSVSTNNSSINHQRDAKNVYKLTFALEAKNRKLRSEQHAAMCRKHQEDFWSAQFSKPTKIEETCALTKKLP